VCVGLFRRKGDRTQLIGENEDESGGSAEPGGTVTAAGGYGAVAFQAAAATGPPPSNGGPDVNLNLGECGQISCVFLRLVNSVTDPDPTRIYNLSCLLRDFTGILTVNVKKQ
jgi:hypothetical protein